jgi:hypothetical protein
MATTYIVNGHLGTIYLSQLDPDIITEICPTCGDWDNIIGEFDSRSIEDAANAAILAYENDVAFLPTPADLACVDGYPAYPYEYADLKDMWDEVEDAFTEEHLRRYGELLQKNCHRGCEFKDEAIDLMVSRRDEYIKDYSFILDAMGENR